MNLVIWIRAKGEEGEVRKRIKEGEQNEGLKEYKGKYREERALNRRNGRTEGKRKEKIEWGRIGETGQQMIE